MTEKILKDEVLNDDELEQVSGGGERQDRGDSDFLNQLGYKHERKYYNWGDAEYLHTELIEQAWAAAGVKAILDESIYSNEYYIGGKQVSRKDAFIHVMKKRGWNQVAIDCFDWDDVQGSW